MLEPPASPDRTPRAVTTTVTGTEEGRAFYQQRLSLAGLCIFLLAGGTWLVFVIAYLVTPHEGQTIVYHPLKQGGPYHLAQALMAGRARLPPPARRAGRPGPAPPAPHPCR